MYDFQIKTTQGMEFYDIKLNEFNAAADINRKLYDYKYDSQCYEEVTETYNHLGKEYYKKVTQRKKNNTGTREILKAHQLLTANEQYALKLKKIDIAKIRFLIDHIVIKNMSFDQFCKKYQITKQSKSRLKTMLEQFEIYKNTINNEMKINPSLSYDIYYQNNRLQDYRNKFFPILGSQLHE